MTALLSLLDEVGLSSCVVYQCVFISAMSNSNSLRSRHGAGGKPRRSTGGARCRSQATAGAGANLFATTLFGGQIQLAARINPCGPLTALAGQLNASVSYL
jgi:hypothetical protein